MSKTTKKGIQKTRKKRKSPVLDSSNVIIVTHTTEKETLFPEKLKKMNEMLSNAQLRHA
jgi:hypothetical protein